ncbi:bifunctional 4-hydroxy-2-oxoglutarate aldolase/2-dehydro-3-deoxy-phosphogluconate aldolase [Pedobacter sp. JY14-1]|uniref:bifunctional 4-hydroxy-2-oxoglutarate aldolase/2-dehydro-3-deoxy-phosphogluconate aldolase n=1 Tax=Pedobacter sp. JY14-1 TaxID=3034151 RepID=UPI0023E323E9|nr:bifunctional 4-hydroxy-2-oxoglutarate aldolase/2-dehydro-3-deoxy-phosphogluconate aldolase [Pedobacter sp. JY14-1]
MNKSENILQKIQAYPIIPVYYNEDLRICTEILKACYAGGLRVFEFTNRGTAALHNFKALLTLRDTHFPDMSLGIGTIKTTDQAKTYIDAGADFLVSPVFSSELAALTAKQQILWIPGCMTPTEIANAEAAGATLIKLFPGDTLKPSFLKAIKPLFPDLKFMPTGGVSPDEESIRTWFKAGVTAVGLGSKLFQREDASSQAVQNYSWLEERCRQLLLFLRSS